MYSELDEPFHVAVVAVEIVLAAVSYCVVDVNLEVL